MVKLEFFWDAASPYTFLAPTQIDGLRQRTGVEVIYRPFLLGGVFKATGNSMPASLPTKAAFLLKDLGRWAGVFFLPDHRNLSTRRRLQ